MLIQNDSADRLMYVFNLRQAIIHCTKCEPVAQMANLSYMQIFINKQNVKLYWTNSVLNPKNGKDEKVKFQDYET